MLLPTKGLNASRTLIVIGAEIIQVIDAPITVSLLWEKYSRHFRETRNDETLTFDWFAMALAMLFACGVLRFSRGGRLEKNHVS